MNIVQVPADPSNYTARVTKKRGIVFHWMVGEIAACDATFKNPSRNASAHYGVGSNGEIHQYVPDDYIAWHAGNGLANVNYIGIEHAGGQLLPDGTRKKPTQACHDASVELCRYLSKKHGFVLEYGRNAFRHNDVSDKPTQCCGTLDIDYIINKTNAEEKPVWIEWNQAIKDKGYLGGDGLINDPNTPLEHAILEKAYELVSLMQSDSEWKNNRSHAFTKKLYDYVIASIAV